MPADRAEIVNTINQMEDPRPASELYENDNYQYSEKWTRFMILWTTFPEVFIGSILLSILAVLATIFISKFMACLPMENCDVKYDNYGEPMETRKNSKKLLLKQNKTMLQKGDCDVPINSKFKSKSKKAAEKIEAGLSQTELMEEKKTQQEQIKAIFDLMKNQNLGMTDVTEVEEQMKLYI